MKTIMCGLVVGVLCFGTVAWPQEIRIAARAVASKKLSAELVATKALDGKLLGVAADGQAIISARAAAVTPMLQAPGKINLRSGDKDVPKDFDPVGQLLISYKGNKTPTKAELAKANLKLVEDYKPGKFLIVAPVKPVTAASVQVLEDTASVAYAGIDNTLRIVVAPTPVAAAPETEPNDPDFGELWGMLNINAPKAWDVVTSSPVVVGVIDTGVDYKHEDLAANMWTNPDETPDGVDNDGNGIIDDIFGADYVNDDGDPMDDNRHGTHCAGTIGGVGNNGIGVAGVTWNVKIMALKFLSAGGSGSASDAIKCIDYAIAKKVNILSNSWGGGGPTAEMKEAINRAKDAGIIFTAAAGNSGSDNDTDPHYPSSYDCKNIIAVASIDSAEQLSSFSCFGAKSVDIAAPGSDIHSTVPGDGYDSISGTSMATPHVSGAAALVWGHADYAGASWQDVRDVLLEKARPLPSLSGKCVTEATLDIGFLGDGDGSIPDPPTDKCCPVVAFSNFEFGNTYKGDANVAKVSISLDKAMQVHICANTSATTVDGDPVLFTTGFYDDDDTSQMWFESLRFVSIAKADEWANFGSTMVVNLPKGKHVIYWKVWTGDKEIKLDSGSMSVQAFDVTSSSAQARGTSRRSGAIARQLSRRVSVRTDSRGKRVVQLAPARARRSSQTMRPGR